MSKVEICDRIKSSHRALWRYKDNYYIVNIDDINDDYVCSYISNYIFPKGKKLKLSFSKYGLDWAFSIGDFIRN